MSNDGLTLTRNALNNIDSIIDELEAVALEDGVYSTDEKLLIKEIRERIDEYTLVIEKCLEDGIITNDEYSKMKSYELGIIRSAIRIAHRDGIITDEEDRIINKLQDEISNLDKIKY